MAATLPDPTLYDFFREEFEREINKKPQWHRLEVLVVFDRMAIRAMQRYAALKGITLE
jgi:hypothetical protein